MRGFVNINEKFCEYYWEIKILARKIASHIKLCLLSWSLRVIKFIKSKNSLTNTKVYFGLNVEFFKLLITSTHRKYLQKNRINHIQHLWHKHKQAYFCISNISIINTTNTLRWWPWSILMIIHSSSQFRTGTLEIFIFSQNDLSYSSLFMLEILIQCLWYELILT